MSDFYQFDTSTQPVTMYEWDDGKWEREFLRSSESLSVNLDGTITLTKDRGQMLKQTVYTPMASNPALFIETSETYLPSTANATPATSVPHTHLEDDHDEFELHNEVETLHELDVHDVLETHDALETHDDLKLHDETLEHQTLSEGIDPATSASVDTTPLASFSQATNSTATVAASSVRAKYWKDHRDMDHADLKEQESHSLGEIASDAAAQAVTLSDALRILKMAIGQDTAGSQALTPYQVLAADFDGDGGVDLSDALGVIKHVVGSGTHTPVWRFVKAASPELDDMVAHPHQYSALPAVVVDPSTSSDPSIDLVGFLAGDVDASYV